MLYCGDVIQGGVIEEVGVWCVGHKGSCGFDEYSLYSTLTSAEGALHVHVTLLCLSGMYIAGQVSFLFFLPLYRLAHVMYMYIQYNRNL